MFKLPPAPVRTLGVKDGRLTPCPASANCVCSQDSDAKHFIEPICFAGPPDEAMARLKQVLARQPRTTMVAATHNYLHVEFRTAILRFVDDVEFLVNDAAIQVRSASRVGYSDFGVNRKRIETIRSQFNQLRP
jgi:uncharacterized protein (DUF1499 family)